MLKDYNKTVTVKAEEFNGDPSMVSKYDIFQITLQESPNTLLEVLRLKLGIIS